MLVDDDPVHNLLLGTILTQAGFEVRAYESGAAALAQFGDGCDCLITDYHMPGMDGVELIRTVRRTHFSACVVLTGSHGGSIDHEAEAAGAVAVLRKPLDPDLLLKFLEDLSYQASASPPKLGPSTADPSLVEAQAVEIGS